ncbi:aminodeoxychorismate synthase, component I [Alicyclobacillus cellulosilyticus]|uniref:Aminodeoxychorismate synthase, component I n=1 Tax=Alicyclobacillus cellulosilyticus TaxID=1003997 RepID=A0A917K821_9BACL|nr:aminodeoxychorismate synthase component I [Alicyclobacillus cellulosilyticus]GGJ02546.1 aminodeoxychorismate synthase, component I [Alicyclobacillus cellulosilyticus]
MPAHVNERILGGVVVRGVGVDEHTRCAHYHSPLDIIAIRFVCCDVYYPCHACHEAVADHPAVPWPAHRFDEPAVLCGACHRTLTARAYLACGYRCPYCQAPFNPGCGLHRHLYFAETDPSPDEAKPKRAETTVGTQTREARRSGQAETAQNVPRAVPGAPGCLYFDFRGDGLTPFWLTDPVQILSARTAKEVPGVLAAVDAAAQDGYYAAGYVAYEAAPAFDPAFAAHPPGELPLAWFGIYRRPVPAGEMAAPGRRQGDAAGEGHGRPVHAYPTRTTEAASVHPAEDTPAPYQLSAWTCGTEEATYRRHIRFIQDAIANGRTYQVNYTVRLRAGFRGDPFAFFQDLQAAQQGGYAAYLNLGRWHILSASPELFFRLADGWLTTRPMKGTRPRGRWPAEDAAFRAELAASEKDRAENVMIVDLLRNDIGRIAAPGTVIAEPLFSIERYPTVWQMTSTVRGRVGTPGVAEVFRALFPCGSVTGAPKVETMRIIRELEEPRGVYCGAVGFVAPGGRAVFNVAIRTVVVDTAAGCAEFGTGSGVTALSSPEEEYAETLAKASILTARRPTFALLETMRLEGGNILLLDRHLARLAASADYFGFPLDRHALTADLVAFTRRHALSPPTRLRLVLMPDGRWDIAADPLPDAAPWGRPPIDPRPPRPVVWADEPIDPADPFLYHKTTHRIRYEAARRAHPDAFDVLLWNPDGEATEFTIGNVIAEIDGVWWTPPVACGLLAGTLRAWLLAEGWVKERRLTRADIQSAARLWLANSVRGLVPVVLAEGAR